eukprot:10294275-Karenia_brevis.AAC.1
MGHPGGTGLSTAAYYTSWDSEVNGAAWAACCPPQIDNERANCHRPVPSADRILWWGPHHILPVVRRGSPRLHPTLVHWPNC